MPRLRILFPARDYACIPLSGRRCDRLPRGSAWRGRAGARDAQLDRRLGAPSGPVHARLSATSTPTQLYFERDPKRVSCVPDAGVIVRPVRVHREAVGTHSRRGRAAYTQVGASPRPRQALLLTYVWPQPLEPTQPDGRVPHPGRRSERLQRGVAREGRGARAEGARGRRSALPRIGRRRAKRRDGRLERARGGSNATGGGSLGLQRSFLTFIFHSQHNFTGLASPHRDMATGDEFRYLGARAPSPTA